jgi:cytoskeletal protein RodZ
VTAEIPVVASEVAPWDETIVVSAPAIHEAFVEPRRQRPRSRSHRVGMLAGLGVVGALLAVLLVFAPGGSKPRLPAQSVHDVSPIAASGPRTDAATTPSTAAPTTTSSAPAAPTTTQPHQSETITTFVTYTLVPGTATPATTAPPATTPTAPPATTTTTTPPTTTTTTAPPQHCLLGLCGL